MNINLLIANIGGCCAKTTFTKHCLAPLISNSVRISIEDWNTGDGLADLEISAKSFYTLAAQINTDRKHSFLLDVGASNCKPMFKNLGDLDLTREQINFFIVPVRSGSRERIDTLRTIEKLIDMGVKAETIIVIAQVVQDISQFDHDFGPIIEAAKISGFVFAQQAVLYNEVYDLLKGTDTSVFDIVRNEPDFKSLQQVHSADEQKLVEIGNQMLIFSLAKTAARNLRSVFLSTPLAAAVEDLRGDRI